MEVNNRMNKEDFIRRFAGLVITAGLLGGWVIHEYIYLVVLFIGLNLFQSSFTGVCPAESIYDRLLSG